MRTTCLFQFLACGAVRNHCTLRGLKEQKYILSRVLGGSGEGPSRLSRSWGSRDHWVAATYPQLLRLLLARMGLSYGPSSLLPLLRTMVVGFSHPPHPPHKAGKASSPSLPELHLQRSLFQRRSHSEVLNGCEFSKDAIQPTEHLFWVVLFRKCPHSPAHPQDRFYYCYLPPELPR